MKWNYRVLRHDGYLAIHETFYQVSKGSKPNGHAVDPAEVVADTNKGDEAALMGLKLTLERMLECLSLPILTPDEIWPPPEGSKP